MRYNRFESWALSGTGTQHMDKHEVPTVIGTIDHLSHPGFSFAVSDADEACSSNDAAIGLFNALAEQVNLFPGGLVRYDADEKSGYHVTMVSQSFLDMLGFESVDDFARKFDCRYDRIVFEDDRERTLELIRSENPIRTTDFNLYRLIKADGSPLWVYDRGGVVDDGTGHKSVYVILLDAQEFMEEQAVLRWQKTKLDLLEGIPGIVSFDYDPATDVFTASFSNREGETVRHSYEHFVEDAGEKEWIAKESLGEFANVSSLVLGESAMSEFEVRINVGDMGFDWYQAACKSVTDNNDKVYRVVGRAINIEHYKQQVSKWQERARHDSLTGVANHGWLIESMRRELTRNGSGTLIMIDIDDFKGVNDACGHLKGDDVLRSVAMALLDAFRATDIIGRYGGDEFAVFLPCVTDRELARRRAKDVMKRISLLGDDFGIDITASVAVKIVDGGDCTPEQFIKEADTALYKSKRNGKDRCTFA